MIKKYYDSDCDLSLIAKKTIAIIGFGSQGHAHAQNLKDSGCKVVVGLRKDSSRVKDAKKAGLEVLEVAAAAKKADIVMLLVPDELCADIYEREIAPNLEAGNVLAFAHGFNIHFSMIKPAKSLSRFCFWLSCPIDTQVSVMMTCASFKARILSVLMSSFAPEFRAFSLAKAKISALIS